MEQFNSKRNDSDANWESKPLIYEGIVLTGYDSRT